MKESKGKESGFQVGGEVGRNCDEQRAGKL